MSSGLGTERIKPKGSFISKVKKEIEKDEFLRRAYLALSQSDETPADILGSKFGEVIERTVDYVIADVSVTMSYSGSIGYDSEEIYYERNSKGEPVKKTRTITDWKPYNGVTTYESTESAYSGTDANLPKLKSVKNVQLESEEISTPVEVDGATINSIKYSAEFGCRLSIKWPGDRKKDEHYNAKSTCDNFIVIRIPFYEMEYEYKGTKYSVCALAINEPHMAFTNPKTAESELVTDTDGAGYNSYTQKSEFYAKVKKETEEQIKKVPFGELPIIKKVPLINKIKFGNIQTISKFAWILIAVCVLLVGFLPVWSIVFPILGAGLALLLAYAYDNEYNELFAKFLNDDLASNITKKNKVIEEKIEGAKTFFKLKGITLTESDLANYPKQIEIKKHQTPKEYKVSRTFTYIIVSIFAVAVSFFAVIGK